MKNKEIRRIADEAMRGKWKRAIGISILYSLIVGTINLVFRFVPLIGQLISLIISVPLIFGYTKQIMLLANGEEVGLVDFFELGFKKFGMVWCCNLWIFVKCILPIALFILVPLCAAILPVQIAMIISVIDIIVAVVWLVIVLLRYVMINYAIAYDDSNLSSKELIDRISKESWGKIGDFVAMNIYYFLRTFVIVFGLIFLMGIVTVFIVRNVIVSYAFVAVLQLIITLLICVLAAFVSLYYGIKNIAACNEFYKIRVLGSNEGEEIY